MGTHTMREPAVHAAKLTSAVRWGERQHCPPPRPPAGRTSDASSPLASWTGHRSARPCRSIAAAGVARAQTPSTGPRERSPASLECPRRLEPPPFIPTPSTYRLSPANEDAERSTGSLQCQPTLWHTHVPRIPSSHGPSEEVPAPRRRMAKPHACETPGTRWVTPPPHPDVSAPSSPSWVHRGSGPLDFRRDGLDPPGRAGCLPPPSE